MSSTEPRSRGPPAFTEEDKKFVAVQAYLDDRTIPTDDVLALTHKRCRDEGLPAIAVSQSQGVVSEMRLDGSAFLKCSTVAGDHHSDDGCQARARDWDSRRVRKKFIADDNNTVGTAPSILDGRYRPTVKSTRLKSLNITRK